MATPITPEELVSQLRSVEADLELFEHETLLTVATGKEWFAGKCDYAMAKNLLLKDKNGKLVHIAAMDSTEVDMKVLALRLGLGKKHPRMAPPEALAEIMQVPPGCLTPFAHCRPETKNVVLLLDEKLKAEKKVLFHPLRNDQSVGITVQGLETYLRQIGREFTYVNFGQKDFKISKDNPPDLKPLLDAVEKYTFAAGGADAKAPTTAQAGNSSGGKSGKKDKKAKAAGGGGGKKSAAKEDKGGSGLKGDNVHELMAEIQDILASVAIDREDKVYKDLEFRLNAFKNVAYTRGYVAAKTEILEMIK